MFHKWVPPKSGSSVSKKPLDVCRLQYVLAVPVWLCDRAERQNYAEKQRLPLVANQLCGFVTLADQVDQVLQLNGVHN